jgi:hypothetical protein
MNFDCMLQAAFIGSGEEREWSIEREGSTDAHRHVAAKHPIM